ncbi:MAG: hypothetical protein ABEJ83_02400 [Candidatus Nanohaloarchaea archaeon]
MSQEKTREWIKEKMKEGVSEDRIREVLENTGRDPSLVDKVDNPFADGDVELSDEEAGEKEEGDESEEQLEQELGSEKAGMLSGLSLEGFDGFGAVDRRKIAGFLGVGVLLVVAVLGLGFSDGFSFSADYTGCRGLVDIQSVSVESGETVVDASVTRNKTTVVLEVREDGELLDRVESTFLGERTLRSGSVGDRVVLHPKDCSRIFSQRRY